MSSIVRDPIFGIAFRLCDRFTVAIGPSWLRTAASAYRPDGDCDALTDFDRQLLRAGEEYWAAPEASMFAKFEEDMMREIAKAFGCGTRAQGVNRNECRETKEGGA